MDFGDIFNGISNGLSTVTNGLSTVTNTGSSFLEGIKNNVNTVLDPINTHHDNTEVANNVSNQINSGVKEFRKSLAPVQGQYLGAMYDSDGNPIRTIGTSLDKFDDTINALSVNNNKQFNAGDTSNVLSYYNPMTQDIIDKARKSVEGGAGSSLQSSATNRNVASAVGDVAANQWQAAFNNAMSDSQNNQNVLNSSANMANMQLQNDVAPTTNWADLTSDIASQGLNADLTKANITGQAAIADNSGILQQINNLGTPRIR